jgi:hypothetical protein
VSSCDVGPGSCEDGVYTCSIAVIVTCVWGGSALCNPTGRRDVRAREGPGAQQYCRLPSEAV